MAASPSQFNALARGVDMKLVADKGQVSSSACSANAPTSPR
jgi:hypothetical protein